MYGMLCMWFFFVFCIQDAAILFFYHCKISLKVYLVGWKDRNFAIHWDVADWHWLCVHGKFPMRKSYYRETIFCQRVNFHFRYKFKLFFLYGARIRLIVNAPGYSFVFENKLLKTCFSHKLWDLVFEKQFIAGFGVKN